MYKCIDFKNLGHRAINQTAQLKYAGLIYLLNQRRKNIKQLGI